MIIVTENREKDIVELFIPFCPLCKTPMQPDAGLMTTPREDTYLGGNRPKFSIKTRGKPVLPRKLLKNTAPGMEGTQTAYATIASFTMACPHHRSERESLTQAQIDVINRYPVQKQVYRKVDLIKHTS